MKYLVLLSVVVIAFTMTTQLFAQNFGVKSGLNFSNIVVKHDHTDRDNYEDDYGMDLGFHIGATAEYPLTEIISLEAGLLLLKKGFKYDFSGEGRRINRKWNLLYLDIPLTAKAAVDLTGTKFYGFLGPNLGIGLDGTQESIRTYGSSTYTSKGDIKWGASPTSLERLDFGLKMGAGVEVSAIHIILTYGLGLTNIARVHSIFLYSSQERELMVYSRYLGLSVGYKFGGS